MNRTCLAAKAAFAGLLLLAGAALVGPSALASAQSVTFGIRPAHGSPDDLTRGAYFHYTLEAGTGLTDEALISNSGSEPITLKLYSADGITATNGGTAFANRDEDRTGDRTWVTPALAEVTIEPGTSLTVPFAVVAPAGARPGDHVAGLIAEAPPKAAQNTGGVQTQVIERVGVAVVVRVPGEVVESLAMGDFCYNQESGSNYFEVNVTNTGNVLTRGAGSFRLLTKGGDHVFERPLDLGTVLPGTSTIVRVHSPAEPPPGAYQAVLVLQETGGGGLGTATDVVIPDKKVNGCKPEGGGPKPASEINPDDNFNIPGVSSVSGGSGVVIALLAVLVGVIAVMGGAIVFILLRTRRPAPPAPPAAP